MFWLDIEVLLARSSASSALKICCLASCTNRFCSSFCNSKCGLDLIKKHAIRPSSFPWCQYWASQHRPSSSPTAPRLHRIYIASHPSVQKNDLTYRYCSKLCNIRVLVAEMDNPNSKSSKRLRPIPETSELLSFHPVNDIMPPFFHVATNARTRPLRFQPWRGTTGKMGSLRWWMVYMCSQESRVQKNRCTSSSSSGESILALSSNMLWLCWTHTAKSHFPILAASLPPLCIQKILDGNRSEHEDFHLGHKQNEVWPKRLRLSFPRQLNRKVRTTCSIFLETEIESTTSHQFATMSTVCSQLFSMTYSLGWICICMRFSGKNCVLTCPNRSYLPMDLFHIIVEFSKQEHGIGILKWAMWLWSISMWLMNRAPETLEVHSKHASCTVTGSLPQTACRRCR